MNSITLENVARDNSKNLTVDLLPSPRKLEQIRQTFDSIDSKWLNASERFVKQQIASTLSRFSARRESVVPLDSSEFSWLNIYSLLRSNNELNEACNKLWCCVELDNVTSSKVWNKSYKPVGEKFHPLFSTSTTIPTLYYSEISAVLSILSAFGVTPLVLGSRVYLIRCVDGWRIVDRKRYINTTLASGSTNGWHNQILSTYESLTKLGIDLPDIKLSKIRELMSLRNKVHYEILSDLTMWRASNSKNSYQDYVHHCISAIRTSIETLNSIKPITNGCDVRFQNLLENMKELG
jgi:hypothetical protein